MSVLIAIVMLVLAIDGRPKPGGQPWQWFAWSLAMAACAFAVVALEWLDKVYR